MKKLSLRDFLERHGNLTLKVAPHAAPDRFQATCILPVKAGAPDHHSRAPTPEEAIAKLYRYIESLEAHP